MPQRPVNGTRSEYPLIGVERRLADIEQRTRQIPSRIGNNASSPAVAETITKTAHGLAVGDVIKRNGYTKAAIADDGLGVVEVVYNANSFRVVWSGLFKVTTALFTAGTLYYLSEATAGLLTTTATTAVTVNRRAILFALTDREAHVFAPSIEKTHNHKFSELGDVAGSPGSVTGVVTGGLGPVSEPGVPSSLVRRFENGPSGIVDSGVGFVRAAVVVNTGVVLTGYVLSKTAGVWASATADNTGPNDIIGFNLGVGSGTTTLVAVAGTMVVDYGRILSDWGGKIGVPVYLTGTAGTIGTTRPTSGQAKPIAFMSSDSGEAFIFGMPSERGQLSDAIDVDITGRANGDVLIWDDTLEVYYHDSLGTASLADNAVGNAKLRDSAAVSVIGRSANTAGDPADIAAASNGHFLRRKADVLGFGAIEVADLGAAPAAAKMLLCTSATAHDWIAMSGDATIGATGALTLANSGATAGTTGSASVVAVITVDAKGRVTAVTPATITPAAIGAVDTATFAAHTHSTGGDISGNLGTVSVDKIKGKAVPAAPADKTFMRYSNTSGAWEAYGPLLAARGDLLTRDGSDLSIIGISGSIGKFLKSNGTDPAWALPLIDDCDDVLITSVASGDLLQYDAVTSDWVNRTVDTVASGTSKLLPMGGFGTQTSRTTTGTHNFTAGKKFCMAIIRGAGGGGGGGSAASGSASTAGGGGGQGEIRIVLAPIGSATTASVTIGAAGTGGATGANGTDGGDTSITINGTTYTAKGGEKGFTSRGGAGGASTTEPSNNSGLNIAIPGHDGHDGCIRSITYNGTGNVTSYAVGLGIGGGGLAPRGTGGAGGTVTSAGSPGIAGSVEIYER